MPGRTRPFQAWASQALPSRGRPLRGQAWLHNCEIHDHDYATSRRWLCDFMTATLRQRHNAQIARCAALTLSLLHNDDFTDATSWRWFHDGDFTTATQLGSTTSQMLLRKRDFTNANSRTQLHKCDFTTRHVHTWTMAWNMRTWSITCAKDMCSEN